MLQQKQSRAFHNMTFMLSTLAVSILSAQYGYAANMPEAGRSIQNIAYATYVAPDGKSQQSVSNSVEINVSALYAIALTTPPIQEIEPSTRVIWANTLVNNSNAPVNVQLDALNINELSNIKIYVDSNKNGQFDTDDQQLTTTVALAMGESVHLWVVATANASLAESQQLNLPLKATLVEDQNVVAMATDSAISYGPQLVATKEVAQKTFEPSANANYDLNYTLAITNQGKKAARPVEVMIDGQAQKMVLVVDELPANTTFKSAQLKNTQAKVLYKQTGNNYTTTLPSDLSKVDQLVVGFPQIDANTTEQIDLTVTMNRNIAKTTVKNTYKVSYATTSSQKELLSNPALTVVGGLAAINNKSGDFQSVLTTGSVNKPLHLEAQNASCNADRYTVDKVKIKITSTKTGDVEEVTGVETGPNTGVFHYTLPTAFADVGIAYDALLQTVKRDKVQVSLTDCLDAQGHSTQTFTDISTQVLMDPYGTVFDAKTGQPVAGATVTLLDQNGQPIADNIAYKVDEQTGELVSIPAKQVTNSAGEFIYPLVKAGTYSFVVDTTTIPGNTRYRFVSDKSVYPSFPADKAVDLEWSYAGKFTLNNGDPALNIDIPIDPDLTLPTSPLFVQKVATNKNSEIGEFEEYTVTVANRGTVDSKDVSITDTLPRGFIYVQGSMRVDGTRVADPLGGKGPYLKLGLGTLTPTKEVKVQYRVYIGPNALNGDGINRVRAKDGQGIESNEASAKVEVTPGAMISDGFIVGKIFTDCNRNGVQDVGEVGVPGVRIYLEDGSYVVTDSEGKYDFYGISAKTHVLKVDRTSLPVDSELVLIGNRQAGDPNSRFVDLKRGELHRADFAIANGAGQCSQALLQQIAERKKRIEQDNTNLEQVLRSDLTIDPVFSKITDVKGQPASGCISAQGIRANCNLDFSREQVKELKEITFEPEKSGVASSGASPLTETLATGNGSTDSTQTAKMLNLETVLENAANNQLEIINLKDGQLLGYAQTAVQVKGAAGTQLQLWVNGAQVSEKRIGKRAILPDLQLAGLDFIGVDLAVGKNTIEVRQVDMMGNVRESKQLSVMVPDQMDKLLLESAKAQPQANGRDYFNVTMKIVDRNGTLVSSRTPVTLDSSIGKIDLTDLDPKQAGIQVFVEGGTLVVPIQAPIEAGEGTLSVESGIFHSSTPIRFLPDLRPIIAVGLVEGSINFKKFDPKQLSNVRSQDGFEEELQEISSSDNGKSNVTGRAAMFLKGKVKGEYLLTLAYDSDKDKNQRLFRDIRPDEYYPVYGDSAAKGFDAQTTSKLYVRVDKGRSYAMYGDYVTRTENDEGLALGQYSRSLTGVRGAIETDRYKVTAFAAQTNTQQVTNEQRAMGISGPYSMGNVNNDDVLANSEKVEVITRDRNNPGLIISRNTLARFTDYEVDTFSNSIYLKDPVTSVDADLNPVYLRITVESDQGGDQYTVGGVTGSVKLLDQVKVGGAYVKSNNPLTQDQLASVNTVVKFADKGKLIAEFARSENINEGLDSLTQINSTPDATGKLSGNAARVELNYAYKNIELKTYHNQSDIGFYNTAAPITAGRKESGIKGRAQLGKIGLAKLEAIRTEDLQSGVNQGVSASIERAISRIVAVELGLKYYDESENPALLGASQTAPYHGLTARTKITTQLPWQGSNIFAEYEQDVAEAERRIFALGANYQINSKLRAYGRHELVSSIQGLYDLNNNQRRNVTVFGLDSKYNNNGTAFSEYRVRDGISAREAEAAIGLRNRWELEKGFYATASFEKVKSLSKADSDNQNSDNTAASLGMEYLANPNWKAVARIEARWADQSDTILNNLGIAYKYSDDVTLLAKNVISLTDNKSENSGNRLVDRFQIGAAYRDTEHNRFDALSKVEYRYDKNQSDVNNPYLKHVYIFSNHLNYHPTRDLTLSGQYAVKNVDTTFSGLASSGMTHMLSGRVMYDINERWDAGVHTGMLWSNMSSGRRVLVGGEVGYLLAANLWLSGGYNFSGYKDDDLVDSDTTIQGAYVRFRFKFDENLFSRNNSSVNASREP